jgi:hypothetical protein
MPTPASVGTRGVSAGTVLRYLLGATIVVGGLIASAVLTAHQTSRLASDIHAERLRTCTATLSSSCLATYRATALQQVSASSSSATVLLRSPFSAFTDDRDECFGTSCIDFVRIPRKDAALLQYPEAVRIIAGDGRVVRITAGGTQFTTLDAITSSTVLSVVSDLVTGLYLLAVCAAFTAGYVVLAIRSGIWKLHPVRWIRGLTLVQVLSGVASVAFFVGFAAGNTVGFGIAAFAFLALFFVAHVARRHHRQATVPLTDGATAREVAFADRHEGPMMIALYLLCAFPVWLGIDVCLLLIGSGSSVPGSLVAAVLGIALAGFFIYKMRRSMQRAGGARRARRLGQHAT